MLHRKQLNKLKRIFERGEQDLPTTPSFIKKETIKPVNKLKPKQEDLKESLCFGNPFVTRNCSVCKLQAPCLLVKLSNKHRRRSDFKYRKNK